MTGSVDQTLDVTGFCSLSPANWKLQVQIDGVHENDLLGPRRRLPPLSGRVVQRGRSGDLIGFGWPGVYLMSERMRAFLEGSGLTGWYAEAVQVESDLFDGPIWILGISGRSGPTYSAARNPLPGLPLLGEFLDRTDWDGSDFFRPENLTGFLITSRAATALRKARLRNISVECGSLQPLPNLA